MSVAIQKIANQTVRHKPRIGFVGVGWIGLNRLQAIVESDIVQVTGIQDAQPAAVSQAQKWSPRAQVFSSLPDLLEDNPDGIVIATPNAFHAEQSIAALKRGIAVFCQKPLSRDAAEAKQVVDAARQSNAYLDVDLSYRFIPAMRRVTEWVQTGALGRIFAVDLKFYNGYGPDKPWFYDRKLSGGGCVLDLGTHLIDLALRPLGFPRVTHVSSSLFKEGRLLCKPCEEVEDFAVAQLQTGGDAVLNLACLWKANTGSHATIEILFHGTEGAAALRNVAGSFYDFVAERYCGVHIEKFESEYDLNGGWGGLASIEWCKAIASGARFNADCETLIDVARIVDQIYGRS